jgi:hypothetical protein
MTPCPNKLMRPEAAKAGVPCPRCGGPGARVVALASPASHSLVTCPSPACGTFVWDALARTRVGRASTPHLETLEPR